jgi:hypothetical protein
MNAESMKSHSYGHSSRRNRSSGQTEVASLTFAGKQRNGSLSHAHGGLEAQRQVVLLASGHFFSLFRVGAKVLLSSSLPWSESLE